MEQFYLKNASLYDTLVEQFRPAVPIEPETTTTSPSIVVGVRIRPLLNDDNAAEFPCAVFPRLTQPGVVDIHDLYNHPRKPLLNSSIYRVDKVFDQETPTEDVYSNLVADLVPYAWNGGIGTLFAYGQTGSGKTFTVSRLEELVAETLLDSNLDGQREIYLTVVDLAGNSAFDLLQERKPISVLEDSFGVTHLAGADEHLVRNKEEVKELIEQAASFRWTAPTLRNDASSRSHAICRLRIKNPADNSEGILYLIDLAGSEAARDRSAHGVDRMREYKEINMSLSVLKDCIRGRVEADAFSTEDKTRRRPRVPFRQSALTKILKHVFDPESDQACKTVVLACVNPSLADVKPSKNTLRYAETLRVLLPAAAETTSGPKPPMTWTNAELKEWIAKNSGTPSISPEFLAPTGSGARLLQLTASEFEERCMKTPGVTFEQAMAFRSKLWQLHVDSKKAKNMSTTRASTGPTSAIYSSRDADPTHKTIQFQGRIRPGMVISWEPSSEQCSTLGLTDGLKLAVVLCPERAGNDGAADVGQYRCALVAKAVLPEAYELHLWRQVVIDVDMMENEVILEYDGATRYYFIAV